MSRKNPASVCSIQAYDPEGLSALFVFDASPPDAHAVLHFKEKIP